jgi:pimeloyl-ACP methyl ester carboxylesterase
MAKPDSAQRPVPDRDIVTAPAPRWVTTSDNYRLAVHEHGDPANPTILCVHGFPDDHRLWDGLVRLLSDKYHVVTFDNRGAGESDHPKSVAAYVLEQLADDVAAVARAVKPGGRVHTVGHNWGGAGLWQLALHPVDDTEILSLTTIGSASGEYYSAWVRDLFRFDRQRLTDLFGTWRTNTYMTAFQIPVLAPLIFRSGLADGALMLAKLGFEAGKEPAGYSKRLAARNRDGLRIYTANVYQQMLGRKPPRRNTHEPRQATPSLVIVPSHDIIITPASQAGAAEWALDCRIRYVEGGHWIPSHQPDVIAKMVVEFVEEIEAR